MKRYCRWGKLLGIMLGLVLPLFAGCGILPDLTQGKEEPANPARLEISLDAVIPEGVTIVWDPALVAVDSTEVSVDGGAEEEGRKVVVTVELRPAGR